MGLGALPGDSYSVATGVSADGNLVVGESAPTDFALPRHAFLWTAVAGMVELPPLNGALGASARGISADGAVVVGVSRLSDVPPPVGLDQATAWVLGQPHSLGNTPRNELIPNFANAASGDGSVIVGAGSERVGFGPGPLQAFVWTPRQGMRVLRDVLVKRGLGGALRGWRLEDATGVSADGTAIVGVGVNPKGQPEAFLASLGGGARR